MYKSLILASAVGLASTLPIQSQAATLVDLELALLIDVSGSVNSTEYNLQRQGYVDAFNSAVVQGAIGNGVLGSIAASVVFWSGSNQQVQSVGWTLIDDAASAGAFASLIAAVVRPFSGQTAPGSAIDFIVNSAPETFASNQFDGTRNVIDVSGDGSRNSGSDTAASRDAALGAGNIDAINGIAIGGSASVEAFYQASIVGGVGSFFASADSFDDFDTAIRGKLIAEIQPNVVPLPAAGWMLLAGIGGLAGLRRRKP